MTLYDRIGCLQYQELEMIRVIPTDTFIIVIIFPYLVDWGF